MKKVIVLLSVVCLVFLFTTTVNAEKPSDRGFDDAGYNNQANIFNGTAWSWCMDKFSNNSTFCNSYLGSYADDKLIMKWNNEWVRGNEENWSNPPYKAWEDNEWNGMFEGGSGSVWHYKIVWVGECGADGTLLDNGGYCIWGQFATIMDQGVDPSYGGGHTWVAHGLPTGYGAYP